MAVQWEIHWENPHAWLFSKKERGGGDLDFCKFTCFNYFSTLSTMIFPPPQYPPKREITQGEEEQQELMYSQQSSSSMPIFWIIPQRVDGKKKKDKV